MKFVAISAVVCCLLLSACSRCKSTPAGADSAIQLVTPLQLGGKSYTSLRAADVPALRRLKVNLDPDNQLVLMSGDEKSTVTVHTIEEWETMTAKGYYARSTADMATQEPFIDAAIICKAVQNAKPARVSYVKNTKVKDLELLSVCVLPWFGSDQEAEHKELEAKGVSIAHLVKQKRIRAEDLDSGRGVRLIWRGNPTAPTTNNEEDVGGELTQALWEIARSDFDGDGYEDILIRTFTHLDGSGFYSKYYLLTRTKPLGLWVMKGLSCHE